jgi:pyruvate formate lyase activating enzyme
MGCETGAAPSQTGVVFNIQKFSLDDGPGIRTTVFLKGCPLRCKACCNPEGLEPRPQLMFKSAYCLGETQCGRCLTVCPVDAIAAGGAGAVVVDFAKCTQCGACAKTCPSEALGMVGRSMTVDQVLEVVEQDEAFYSRSGGGLTLSGGEVLMQGEFARALLAAAKARGLSTAIETSGLGSWRALKGLLPHLDVVHFDIKCLDDDRHRRFTGASNREILANFQRLCAAFPPARIFVRTTFIPGFNGAAEDIEAIRLFLASISPDLNHEILPYHALGEVKYGFLGRAYPMCAEPEPPAASLDDHRRLSHLRARERILVPLSEVGAQPMED